MLKLPKNCGNCICNNSDTCKMLSIAIGDPCARPDCCPFNKMKTVNKDDPLVNGLETLCLAFNYKNGFCKE